MTSSVPTIREELNNASPNRLADLFRAVKLGDLLDGLIGHALSSNRVRAARITQAGASPFVVTWAALGFPAPAAATDILAILVNDGGGDAYVAQASITTSQFAITGGADTELLQVTVYYKNDFCQRFTVASNAMAFAAQPAAVLDVVATAGTTLGRKTLKIGTGLTPATGEVVWDGGVNLTFAAVDAVTKAEVTFLPGTAPGQSFIDRLLGQRDSV